MSKEVQQTKNSAPGDSLIKRFVTNTHSSTKMNGELTADELNETGKHWIKAIKSQSFSSETDLLKAGKCPNARMQELKPFLDEDELLSGSSILISLTEKSTHGFCSTITDIQKY